jgi:hypothetical protein
MAARVTIIVTDVTVRIALLTKARQMIPPFVWSTARRFEMNCQCFGHENARLDASAGDFDDWSITKTNGTRKTTKDTMTAMMPTVQARTRTRLIVAPAFC